MWGAERRRIHGPGTPLKVDTLPRALDQNWQAIDEFAEAARALQEHSVQGAHTPELICDLAAKLLRADHASIAGNDGGRIRTIAATSSVPAMVDTIRDEEHEGPIRDALSSGVTVRVDDLGSDPRWPRLGPRVVSEVDVRSLLAYVMPVGESGHASLNVFAARPGAFTSEHESLMTIFGAIATATVRALRLQDDVENFKVALRTSRRIGVALGIVMTTQRRTLDDAWQLMVKESQNRNIKVSVLAETVIHTGGFDAPLGERRKPVSPIVRAAAEPATRRSTTGAPPCALGRHHRKATADTAGPATLQWPPPSPQPGAGVSAPTEAAGVWAAAPSTLPAAVPARDRQ